MSKILVSIHNDDAALFAAFTCLRERPLVVVVFDGYNQAARGLPVTWQQRREEDTAALRELGCYVEFLAFPDDVPVQAQAVTAAIQNFGPTEVWAPARETDGHPQHNLVAVACDSLPVIDRYLTYTGAGKSTSGRPVEILDGEWIAKKLRALSCYRSQMNLDPRMGCVAHFCRGLYEYYAE